MKVILVPVYSTTAMVGLRRIASCALEVVDDVEVCFVPSGNYYSLKYIFRSGSDTDVGGLSDADLLQIAQRLVKADVLGFSSMTEDAETTKRIIAAVKAQGFKGLIIWGGVHPTFDPDDAMEHADAICIGEGERAFNELLEVIRDGGDYYGLSNFWFRRGDQIIKNGSRPLITSKQMDEMPLLLYGEREWMFASGKGFSPMLARDYIGFQGLSYNTIWTQGCPFRCTYCGNSRFLSLDKKYGSIRHPSAKYLINEIKVAMEKHPHLSVIVFHDDCFMALPVELLQEFAALWKSEIKLPFAVFGVTPVYLDREKLEILLDAGLNRLRMGIQHGSDNILKFFRRPNRPGLISDATNVIGDYARYMIPPNYDIIIDVPIETDEDVRTNLQFINNLPRPFTLNVFSLRSIPNTELEEQLSLLGLDVPDINESYYAAAPTVANIMVFMSATFRIPAPLFNRLIKRAHPALTAQPTYPRLMMLVRLFYLTKRFLDHIFKLDFSLVSGTAGWLAWKLGLMKARKYLLPRFKIKT